MLVVKPNPRRMHHMRDSPAENSIPRGRAAYHLRWERVFLAGAVVVTVALGWIVLVMH